MRVFDFGGGGECLGLRFEGMGGVGGGRMGKAGRWFAVRVYVVGVFGYLGLRGEGVIGYVGF